VAGDGCFGSGERRGGARRAARATQPDAGGDVGAFRIAREAFEILSDSVRRAAHDRLLDARAQGQAQGQGQARPGPAPSQGPAPTAPPRDERAPRAWLPFATLMGLLGIPVVSLVLGTAAIALLVVELGRGRGSTVPQADQPARRRARFVQSVAAAPLILGLALAVVAFVIDLVILLLMLVVTLATIGFNFWVLSQ
jgi:multisubunit Na+/H+ antiporter MnhC subunit